MENLDDSDQFILAGNFARNFDVMIDLYNGLIRNRNTDKKYVQLPVSLQPRQAVVAIFWMRNLNSLSDSEQACLIPEPKSQSSVVLGRIFSVTRNGLCVSVLLYTLDTTVSIQRGRKLRYALPMRPDYKYTPNLSMRRVEDCPTYANKDLVFKKLMNRNL